MVEDGAEAGGHRRHSQLLPTNSRLSYQAQQICTDSIVCHIVLHANAMMLWNSTAECRAAGQNRGGAYYGMQLAGLHLQLSKENSHGAVLFQQDNHCLSVKL